MKRKQRLKDDIKNLRREVQGVEHQIKNPYKYIEGFENDYIVIVARWVGYFHYSEIYKDYTILNMYRIIYKKTERVETVNEDHLTNILNIIDSKMI